MSKHEEFHEPAATSLDEREEARLWELYTQTRDREIRDRLIEHYIPLVYQTAESMAKRLPTHIHVEDLISSGSYGLLEAIDMFDPSRGIKFSTYCGLRISGAIIDEFRRLDWPSRLVRTRANRVRRAKKELESRYGRAATDDELAEHLNLDADKYNSLMREVQQVRTMVSLDRKWDENDDHELGPIEMIPDTRIPDPLSELEREEIKEVALRGLSEYQRKVLTLYYYEELNLKEIGAALNLSESRVCQIHAQTLGFLRKKFTQRQIAPTLG